MKRTPELDPLRHCTLGQALDLLIIRAQGVVDANMRAELSGGGYSGPGKRLIEPAIRELEKILGRFSARDKFDFQEEKPDDRKTRRSRQA